MGVSLVYLLRAGLRDNVYSLSASKKVLPNPPAQTPIRADVPIHYVKKVLSDATDVVSQRLAYLGAIECKTIFQLPSPTATLF